MWMLWFSRFTKLNWARKKCLVVLGYILDCTQLRGEYFINRYRDPYETTSIMESRKVFLWLNWYGGGGSVFFSFFSSFELGKVQELSHDCPQKSKSKTPAIKLFSTFFLDEKKHNNVPYTWIFGSICKKNSATFGRWISAHIFFLVNPGRSRYQPNFLFYGPRTPLGHPSNKKIQEIEPTGRTHGTHGPRKNLRIYCSSST